MRQFILLISIVVFSTILYTLVRLNSIRDEGFGGRVSVEPLPSMEGKVPVVMSGDSHEYLALLASVHSALANCAEPDRLHFIFLAELSEVATLRGVLQCGLGEEVTRRWTIVPFERSVLGAIPDSLGHKVVERNLTAPHNFIRFYLHQLLPPSVTKVVYVDADTIVRGDLGLLYDNVLLDDTAAPKPPILAAASHASLAWSRTINVDHPVLRALYPRATECRSEARPKSPEPRCSKFNAGFIVIRLDRWAAENKTQELEFWMQAQIEHKIYEGGSQPPMLLAFLDRVEKLGDEWNTVGISNKADKYSGIDDPKLARAYVLHFTGEHKPWLPGGYYRELWEPYGRGAHCTVPQLAECSCGPTDPIRIGTIDYPTIRAAQVEAPRGH
jgi:hypothetical protein